MLVAAVLCLAASLRVDAPLVVTAQSPASAQETSLLPWFGPRVGFVSAFDGEEAGGKDAGGAFFGGEGLLLFGMDSQGTNEVSVLKLPVLLEGRGLFGARYVGGLFGVGGYGFVGVGVGGGVSFLRAFDDGRTRGFATWGARTGAGLELGFGPAVTRVELGVGARDQRFELSGSFGVGAAF